MNNPPNLERPHACAWSIDRQVRFLSGLLVLLGILLSIVSPGFMALPVVVALGMMLSAVADTCAMGVIVSWFPWNHRS